MINYSFIIPHKNCPDLLMRCVESIPIRDDIQIIIVDDNSDESKRPTINRNGVEIIYLDANQTKGAGRARNVGLEKATGKWLLFPDSDDYYVDGFLGILDSFLEKNIDVVYFNCEYRDGSTYELLPLLDLSKEFEEYDGSQIAVDRVKFHHNAPWTKMVSKDFIDQHSLKFEEVPNGNDILFTFSLGCSTNNIEVVKDPLYVYLRNKNSLTQKKQSENEAFCVVLHKFQMNKFYNSIGHPEWRLPVTKQILYYFKVSGLSIFAKFKRRIHQLCKHSNDWTSLKDNNKEEFSMHEIN